MAVNAAYLPSWSNAEVKLLRKIQFKKGKKNYSEIIILTPL